MKTKPIFALLAAITLTATISSAQSADNSNPYAIFGGKPNIIGSDYGQTNVFVIENFEKGSPVARIEHNPRTRQIKFFDATGKLVKEQTLGPREYGWGVPDPKAEKYPSVSPYAYCNNNPIKYIDPNGETIQVYDYVDNQRIAYEWRQYEGNWGFYNSDNAAYAGANEFIGQLSGALSGLMAGGTTGFDLVSGLVNNSNVVTLMYSERSGADHQNQVGWNPTGVKRDGSLEAVPTTAGMRSDPMMTLGHELGHVADQWSGAQHSTWFTMEAQNGPRDISTSEIYTTHLENQLRSENGLPLRTYYGVDASGYGYGPRIIVPSTGASRYYNVNGVTNYNPLKRGVVPYIYGR